MSRARDNADLGDNYGTFSGTIGSGATFPNSTKNVPAFQATVSGTLDITKNANVLAPFDTVVFDTHSDQGLSAVYDNSSGNYKFTVPTGYAGKYAFQVKVEADDNTNTWDRCTTYFARNGGTVNRLVDLNQSHTKNIAMSSAFVQNLSEGDTIQIYIAFYLNSGTVGEILASSLFSGFRLIGV